MPSALIFNYLSVPAVPVLCIYLSESNIHDLNYTLDIIILIFGAQTTGKP